MVDTKNKTLGFDRKIRKIAELPGEPCHTNQRRNFKIITRGVTRKILGVNQKIKLKRQQLIGQYSNFLPQSTDSTD